MSHPMRRGIAALALIVAVAGCHGDDSAKPSRQDNEAAAAISTAITANSTAAKIEGLPVPQPTAHALAYQIPTSFVGRWGMTKADCDPDSLAVKGLLKIGPDGLKFWESEGDVADITRHSPYDITLRLAMTGEGQSWVSITRLTLDAAATQLVRTEDNRSYRYHRC
ncbi:MAG TPA: hypothetical protein VFT56_11215 [Sphingomonas sp.]|nr:hypothetical protein [Sphingomonas sp.]